MAFFQQLPPHTLILTPNRRLSATLLKQHHLLQLQQHKKTWMSLDILPFTAWLQRLWEEFSAQQLATALPLLLTPQQENLLWLTILGQDTVEYPLLHIPQTATLVKSAWSLLKQWCVNIHDPILNLTDDSRSLKKWALDFSAQCQKNQWLDNDSLADNLIEKIKCKNISLPPHIFLIGFTEICPQHQLLLNYCEEQGTKIDYYESPLTAQSTKKISLLNEEMEIRTMARWAKMIYASQIDKKSLRIGCVVPQLERLRPLVARIFAEIFSDKNTFNSDYIHLPFNISAGTHLSKYPVIHTALLLLKIHHQPLTLATISHLLRTPFLGYAEKEFIARTKLENRLRQKNTATFWLKDMLNTDHHDYIGNDCPLLTTQFIKYLNDISTLERQMTIAEWAHIFSHILTIFGWPGERSLNSEEYQVVQRFLNLLAEFSTYDSLLPVTHFSKAVEYFLYLTHHTVFQIQTPDAPIQILGALEAADLPFDYLWVMQLDDSIWPSAPKPNPFIPKSLQKRLQMPHATAERELAYCQKLMQQFQRSSQYIIFSHSLKTDEMQLRPSALLNTIPEIFLDDLLLAENYSNVEAIFSAQQWEKLTDDHGPPLQNSLAKGGTHLFKLQALCPFKAFVELRLHARGEYSNDLGIKREERGVLVHKAMEYFWKEVKNSATLHQLSSIEINNMIEHSAVAAMNLLRIKSDKQKNYLSLELHRLKKILHHWIKLELTRPSFTVTHVEHQTSSTIGNITFNVRIDRIDELADGTKLVIDYKTGKNHSVEAWLDDRLTEPQLPLYCTMDAKNITAIAYAQINPQKMVLKGLSEHSLDIPAIEILPNWSEQVTKWQSVLEKLAQDFCKGVATIDPKERNETCRNCQLMPICRIHEVMQ